MEKEKITFKKLSTPLKIAFIGGWITVATFLFYFIIGLFEGMLI